jgi:hypothetical protein
MYNLKFVLMRKFIFTALIVLVVCLGISYVKSNNTGAPPYIDGPDLETDSDDLSWLRDWKRPDGPPKVGLQVGHLKNEELPDELARIRGNTGSSGGGKTEIEVNQKIAELTKEILEQKGISVELLPATVPPKYWADVVVAIHADGNLDRSVNGFKITQPRRDYTGNGAKLSELIQESYKDATKLATDPNISRNMTGYYAFNWRRFEHSIHAMTAAAILETGFLSNANDRKIIVNKPELAAYGLSNGIIEYLQLQDQLSGDIR